MHELKITMLGPTYVGKTSLLTAMYEQFESNIGKTNLQLTPDLESAAILQERLVELKSQLDDDGWKAKGGIQGTEAVMGPQSLRSFVFELGKKGAPPSLKLNFRDYPGGYHATKATTEEKEFVKNLLTECIAVIIAIDAPALMEAKGKWHDAINRPQQMTDLFKLAYQGLNSPRLVIFAPVKCEKYLQDEKSAIDLLKRVRDGYSKLLDLFRSESLLPLIAGVVTPVETVGSVVFSRIEVNDGSPHFYFRKISYDAAYSPKHSEQPLRYLLRFLLKRHLDARSWGVFNFLRDWFNQDIHLEEAIREFANGCKTTDGFTVLQGENWIKI